MEVTLTSLSGVEPDIVACKGFDLPTVDNFTWGISTWNDESLFIESDSEEFTKTDLEFKGYYTIGIIGFSEGNFLIQYTSGVKPITRLFPGKPINGYLPANNESMYYFYISEN